MFGLVTEKKLNRIVKAMAAFVGDVTEKLDNFRDTRKLKIQSVDVALEVIEQLNAYVLKENEQIDALDELIEAGEMLQANQAAAAVEVEIPAAVEAAVAAKDAS